MGHGKEEKRKEKEKEKEKRKNGKKRKKRWMTLDRHIFIGEQTVRQKSKKDLEFISPDVENVYPSHFVRLFCFL